MRLPLSICLLVLAVCTHAQKDALALLDEFAAGAVTIDPHGKASAASKSTGDFVGAAAVGTGRASTNAHFVFGGSRAAKNDVKPTARWRIRRPPAVVSDAELAAASRRLSVAARGTRSLVTVGGPPGPITMAERWRLGGTRATACWRAVAMGFVCVDDYANRGIACNPRLAYRAASNPCTETRPAARVDHADTIVLRLSEGVLANLTLPIVGRSSAYFTRTFPTAPRVR